MSVSPPMALRIAMVTASFSSASALSPEGDRHSLLAVVRLVPFCADGNAVG
ncbi:MAG: hypothetical protein KIT83_14355 [Bryobacterales bacterium]|nr:hypothetical protein [Bryobacterales bacterium]